MPYIGQLLLLLSNLLTVAVVQNDSRFDSDLLYLFQWKDFDIVIIQFISLHTY